MNLKDLIAKMDSIEAKGSLLEVDAFQFSPEQEKWLGGANRQDPYILNRMPGEKPPVSYFTDPADQALAKRMKFPGADSSTASVAQAAPNATPRTRGMSTDQSANTATAEPAADSPGTVGTAPGVSPVVAQAASGQGATTTTVEPTPAAVAATSDAASQTPAASTYSIKPGDTLGKIAAANGTTVQAIMAANPQIKDANRIQAGATLNMPSGNSTVATTRPANSAPNISAKPAAPTATPATPTPATGAVPRELTAIAKPTPGQEYWVKGTRYQYLPSGPRGSYEWKPNMKPGDWGWNHNQWAARSGFTGSQDDVKPAYQQAGQTALAQSNRSSNVAAKPAAKESRSIAKELVESFGYKVD